MSEAFAPLFTKSGSQAYNRFAAVSPQIYYMENIMPIGAVIALSAAVFTLFYFLMRFLFSYFAEREISKSREVRRYGKTLEIFACADSLEFYIRMAVAVRDTEIIIVNIDAKSFDAEELAFITENLSCNKGEIKINYIS